MDISFWTKSNPTVKIFNTRKKFFNRYLYKVVTYVPYGRAIFIPDDQSCSNWLALRRHQLLKNGTSFFWPSSTGLHIRKRELDEADSDQLELYRNLRKTIKTGTEFKMRVESPYISIYCQDLGKIQDLIKNDPKLNVKEIHIPKNPAAEEVLERGEIIVKNIDYEYKITLRGNFNIDAATAKSMLVYLENFGDQVMMPRSCRAVLDGTKSWFSPVYFYANDDSILTFLNLMSPGSVISFHKLVKVAQ